MEKKITPVPTRSQHRLTELLTAAQCIQAQNDAMVDTLREAPDVPEDCAIRNVQEGFVASGSIEPAN